LNKKAILIYPVPSMEFSAHVAPPLSILYPGAYAEQNGFSVEYFDLRVDKLSDLKKMLMETPLLVGISSMTGFQLQGALKVIEFVKSHSPVTPIVLGGVHVSCMPGEALKHSLIDYEVIGEGEDTLLELLLYLRGENLSIEQIKGIAWKKGDEIIVNEPRPFIDMNKIPSPITANSLRLYKFYSWGKVEVTRGCPHRCSFCYNSVFNKRRWRSKTIEHVEQEIRRLKKLVPRFDSVSLLSDNIGKDKKYIAGLSDLMGNMKLSWHTGLRADYVDNELISILEKNCKSVFIGVESSSERILNLLNKDLAIEQVIDCARLISKTKIVPYYSFMCGYPDETKEEILATMDFVDRLLTIDPKAIITPFFLCTPYPGTQLYEYALERGLKPPQSLSDWSEYNFNTAFMPWVKDKELYENMYYITLLSLYKEARNYTKTKFEKRFMDYMQEIATLHWKNRNFNFSKERLLYKSFIKEQNRESFYF